MPYLSFDCLRLQLLNLRYQKNMFMINIDRKMSMDTIIMMYYNNTITWLVLQEKKTPYFLKSIICLLIIVHIQYHESIMTKSAISAFVHLVFRHDLSIEHNRNSPVVSLKTNNTLILGFVKLQSTDTATTKTQNICHCSTTKYSTFLTIS